MTNVHFEVTVSRPLAVGLIALLVLLNTYLVSKRLELRRLREETHLQHDSAGACSSAILHGPLTEIYNRRSLEDIAGRFISHRQTF